MKRLTIRNLKIRTKFMLMYVFCVLLPLILTDAYILYSMNRNYQKEQRINLEYAIERIEYNLKENVNKCLLFANSIYSDQALNDF